jgi:peptidoglycan/LPS O-acetylase OafA/YrhL
MPLFFCLSGFLIHSIYHDLATPTPGALRQFFVARFARIYPLYLLLLAVEIYVYYEPAFGGRSFGERVLVLASFLTLTQSWFYAFVGGSVLSLVVFGIAWSISTEWFFYAVYPFLARLLARLRSIGAVALALGATVIAAHLLLYAAFLVVVRVGVDTSPQAFGSSFVRWLFYLSPYVRFLDFLTGALAAQLYLTLPRTISRVERTGGIIVALLMGVLTILIFDRMRIDNANGLHTYYWFLHLSYGLTPMLTVIVFCAARYFRMDGSRALVGAVLAGEASYSLYLLHELFFTRIFAWPYVLAPHAKGYAVHAFALLVSVGFTIAVSLGMFRAFESPLRRFLRRLLAPMRRATTTLVGAGAEPAVPARAPGQ